MDAIKFLDGSDVVFTSYFNSKVNPQRNALGEYEFVPRNNINYIYPWYVTVCHLNLNGVIIHDGLNPDFVERHTRENIQFIQCSPGGLSLNDERFLALYELIKDRHFRRVMMTDGSDVMFKRDPFEFMEDSSTLYVGSDDPTTVRIRDSRWCLKKTQDLKLSNAEVIELDDTYGDFEYVNAGVVGGSMAIMRSLIESLSLLLRMMGNDRNHNMMALNYLIWKYKIKHHKGAPFTSPFKSHAIHGDYYIVHK